MRPRVFLQYSLFCQTLSTQDLRRISSPDRFTDTACRYYHQTNPPHSLGLFSIIITPCVIFTVKYSLRVDGFFCKMYHGCPISSIYQYTMYRYLQALQSSPARWAVPLWSNFNRWSFWIQLSFKNCLFYNNIKCKAIKSYTGFSKFIMKIWHKKFRSRNGQSVCPMW